jgi:hypothetical protein
MRNSIIIACAAIVASGLAFAPAGAAEANLSTCATLSSRVSDALASNAQSPAHSDAERERRYGAEFCGSGFYARGANHYQRALEMLSATSN